MTRAKYDPIPLHGNGIEEEEEEELLREETYDDDSCSSTDDNDNANDTNNNDEDSLSSTGSWKEVVVWSAWRQHAVAVIVAIAATIAAATWQHYRSPPLLHSNNRDQSHQSPVYASTFRHEHLEGYQRTANISFCGTLKPQVYNRLELMDFQLPKESIFALKLHYYADALEDDDYSQVLGAEEPLPDRMISDPEFHCVRQLEETSTSTTRTFIKGQTYFYQAPSYVEMYPSVVHPSSEKDAVSVAGLSPKKARTHLPKPAQLSFTGFGAKFINVSPNPVLLYWDGKGGHDQSRKLVGEIGPFDSLGTATTPGQSFSVSPVYDSSFALDRWVVTADDAVVIYRDLSKYDQWSTTNQQLYHMQQINLEFAKHYLIASHRTWLAHFPRRFPVHPLHVADYVGQTHVVSVERNNNNNGNGDEQQQSQERRQLNMEVVSVTPRVFSIDNFLTHQECQSLISLAQQQGLHGSTLYAGGMAQQQRDMSTRSSTNTWLGRGTSITTHQIYRRAAQVLNMKEELLQQPPFYLESEDDDDDNNNNGHDATRHSIAESLQVVRYQPGEEYTAHHDFVYPSLRHRYQPTRYATLLLYLNDDFHGGETNFPRAVNPSNHQGITITPKQGKAVLFYNVLPDGNVDDMSQHRSLPVKSGEKWLANLWIWDPVIN